MSSSSISKMNLNKKNLIYSLIILLFSGGVYFKTLAPAVSWIDSGELATVCTTLGIAHPTGYPVYTLIGRLFSLLPFASPVQSLNFLSLCFISFSNLFFFFVLVTIFELLFPELAETWRSYLSLLGSLIFSFTPTLWSQATSNEVYALNSLLNVILFYLILSQLRLKARGNLVRSDKYLYLFFFLYGLSFGNHLSTVLLFPGFIFLLLTVYGKSFFEKKRIFLLVSFFILGVSVYLYLPIRSSLHPILNWETLPIFRTLRDTSAAGSTGSGCSLSLARHSGKVSRAICACFIPSFPFIFFPGSSSVSLHSSKKTGSYLFSSFWFSSLRFFTG